MSRHLLWASLLLVACRSAPTAAPPPSPAAPLAAPPGAGAAPDPDDALYTLGPTLRGKAVRGVGLTGLPGATVRELGGAPTTSGDGGRFALELADEGTIAVQVTAPGFVPTIQIATERSRPYFEGSFKIEMFDAEDERAVELEEFGAPQDPDKGRLVLNFQPYGSAGGVGARLDVPGAQGWVYDDQDRPVRADRLPDAPGPGEIVFRDLPPGPVTVTLSPPSDLLCPGPATVPIQAGVYTRAYYFCQGPEATAATALQIEEWRARGGPPELIPPAD